MRGTRNLQLSKTHPIDSQRSTRQQRRSKQKVEQDAILASIEGRDRLEVNWWQDTVDSVSGRRSHLDQSRYGPRNEDEQRRGTKTRILS